MSKHIPEAPKQLLFLEYEILQDRPGLLGSITTFMGMLDFNIIMVASTGASRRGFLIEVYNDKKIEVLQSTLMEITLIELTAFRTPTFVDRIALKHGKRLDPMKCSPPTYHFLREELGILIDFLGDILTEGENPIIGLRGMPRVGKTEAAIAASVYANKKWVLISSTILRQILRTHLSNDEVTDSVFIIDGLTSTTRGNSEHWNLLNSLFKLPVPKIIEHPDIFLRDGRLEIQLDLILEIRHKREDMIRYEEIPASFSSFDLS